VKPLDPRLLRHAAPVRRFVFGCGALAVVAAVAVVVQAQVLSTVVAHGVLGGGGDVGLGTLVGVLAAVIVVRAGLAWATEVLAHRSAADVVGLLRRKLVAHVLRLGPRDRALPPSGELATLAARGLDDLEGWFGRYLPALLVAAVVPAVVGVRILTADWMSGVLVGLTVPLVPLFAILVGLHTERSTRRQWRALAVLGHHFLDLVAGLDVLAAFGRAGRQGSRLRALAEAHRTATMRTLRVAFLSALVLELVATLSVALVAVSIGLRLVDGSLDLGTGLLVLLLVPEVYLPLRAVGARFHDAAAGAAAASAALDVLDLPAPRSAGVAAPDPARVGMSLRGVRVDGRSGPVLDGLGLDLAPGELLGITGPSGCGKTTLLDLLLALRPPDAGAVRVGGVDLADVARDEWLRHVAWLPQQPVLVTGTVAENIALARPTATPAEIRAAAAAASVDVALDVAVREGGEGLSTGQRRRVGLARAVLADRPLLLLDEPTEGVDPATEAAIVAALPGIYSGRTAVVVSHRHEVLAACDRVVELPATSSAGAAAAAPTPARAPSLAGAAPADRGRPPEKDRSAPWTTSSGPLTGGMRAVLAAARVGPGRLATAAGLGVGALACGVALTATSAWLISTAALHPPVLTLMVAIVAVRAFGLGKGVLRYAERLVSHDAALRAGSALRSRIWDQLVALGPAVTARRRRGDLLTRLVADTDAPQDLLVRIALPAVSALVVSAAAAVTFALLLPAAGLVLAAGLVVAGVGAPALATLTTRRAERMTADARSEVAERTVELLEGAADLIGCGAAAGRIDTLARADGRLTRLRRRSATARGAGAAASVLGIGGAAAGCAVVGASAVAAGTIAGPVLAVLVLTPLALAEVVAPLPEAAVRLLSVRPALRRLAELSRLAPAVVPSPAAETAPRPSALSAVELGVRWPEAAVEAVSGVDLDLAAGRRVALTGPSGSGKSTVVAALLRHLDPSSGQLLADGRDVRVLTPEAVRGAVAWCGPWAHLFDSTLRANLALARPDATDDDLVTALGRARLGGWFDALPEGLDTPVGQHGGAVSGGERQRIGVARALLADRPVLVLDEPTAHLDDVTAQALADELLDATSGRTALVVTHRPDQVAPLPRVDLDRRTTVLSAAAP